MLMRISSKEMSHFLEDGPKEYPIMRLLGFLTAFDQDVEIAMRPHPKAGEGGRVTFTVAAA